METVQIMFRLFERGLYVFDFSSILIQVVLISSTVDVQYIRYQNISKYIGYILAYCISDILLCLLVVPIFTSILFSYFNKNIFRSHLSTSNAQFILHKH